MAKGLRDRIGGVTSLTNLALQKRISLLVLAGLVVGLGLFSWLGVQSLNRSTERTLDERLTIARIMANHLDDTLIHIQLHLKNVADMNHLPASEEFNAVAERLQTRFTESGVSAQAIILTDASGRAIQAEPAGTGAAVMDLSPYPEVARALQTGQPAISNLITGLTPVPVVLVMAPIRNDSGQVIGMLAGAIDIEGSSIRAFSQTVQVGNTGYTEIVDGNGIVLARTRPGSPPKLSEKSDHPGRFAELISEGKATVGTCHRCHETSQNQDVPPKQRDVLAFAPLSTASWGVAIRQSEEEALAPTQQLERRLFLLGLIVLVGTFLLVWSMMQGIVRPIRMLTAAAKKVAAGDFRAAIPVRRQDEIGQLSEAFQTMTQELASSHDELVSRNEELAALNSIAATVSQSLNLKDVLENALQKVLEVTRVSAGCVFLTSPDDPDRLERMICTGLPEVFHCLESASATAGCACHQVLRNRQTLMVNHISQCPMLGGESAGKDIGCFVSVPLKSKDRTLGIMNVACSSERYFTENDFRLLDSIGYHIGLAIENSVLYEEAKQKEQLRGQLLSRVISAQEEERKRIARELHDEYGQTLTGVVMSMEALEGMMTPEQSRLRKKLESTKALVVRALDDIRRLTLDLRPASLDDLGLITAVRTYAHNHLESRGVQVKFDSKGFNERLAPAVETALFRILQEAIFNIVKYAEAKNVSIQLTAGDGRITAVVEDDGRGFDVEAVFRSRIGTKSLGLLGIQERTALLGGTFSIRSQVGHGTTVKVEIPATGSLAKDAARAG